MTSITHTAVTPLSAGFRRREAADAGAAASRRQWLRERVITLPGGHAQLAEGAEVEHRLGQLQHSADDVEQVGGEDQPVRREGRRGEAFALVVRVGPEVGQVPVRPVGLASLYPRHAQRAALRSWASA